MEKKSDKKTIIILLVILAITIIGGGIWTYTNLQPVSIDSDEFSQNNGQLSDINIDQVFRIKDEVIDNVEDFLQVPGSPSTIWEDFYNNPQVGRLKDVEVDINIEDYENNSSPFVIPSSTDDGLDLIER